MSDNSNSQQNLNIGDWGLGIGDWGLGIGPIPNPQSPIFPELFLCFYYLNKFNFKFY
jgi:hypothetical protein